MLEADYGPRSNGLPALLLMDNKAEVMEGNKAYLNQNGLSGSSRVLEPRCGPA